MTGKKLFGKCRCLVCGAEEIYLLNADKVYTTTDCSTCGINTLHRIMKTYTHAEVSAHPGIGHSLKEVRA